MRIITCSLYTCSWLTSSRLNPSAATSTSTETFPGPLFLDPSSAKGAAGAKVKKGVVLSYIDARAAETEHALGWLKTQGASDDVRYREEEGKAVLLRLIGVMVENEGRLSGRSGAASGELSLCTVQLTSPLLVRLLVVPRSRKRSAPSCYPISSPHRAARPERTQRRSS